MLVKLGHNTHKAGVGIQVPFQCWLDVETGQSHHVSQVRYHVSGNGQWGWVVCHQR